MAELEYCISWQRTGRPHHVIRWDMFRGLVEEWIDGQWIEANNETSFIQIRGYDLLFKPIAAPESTDQP